MTHLVDRILGLPGWLLLVVTGLVVLAEDALFVGFVLPGETVALLAGAAAKVGHASLAGVLLVVVFAAVLGDTLGYEVGRHLGVRVLRHRVFDRRRERLDPACDSSSPATRPGRPTRGSSSRSAAAPRSPRRPSW